MLILTLLASFAISAFAASEPAPGNSRISDFNRAKKIANAIHKDHARTLYCGCAYQGSRIDLRSCGYKPQSNPRRAARLEWEHVVPAEAFGRSFVEWRDGAPECVKTSRGGRKRKPYRGRKCAEKNPVFSKMEADLYNLWPEVGELNGLRSNFSMSELSGSKYDFGGCSAKILDRKFEPGPAAKGIVARAYLYMDAAYPGRGIVSDRNRKLFEAWDRMHPATEWECERAERVRRAQGNENLVLKRRCSEARAQAMR